MTKLSVTLKLFYGAVTYDASGKVTSKAENISLQYGTPEWVNFLKHLRANGITKADVTSVYDLTKVNESKPVESSERYREVEDVENIQSEVDQYVKTPEAELTPDQKKIKDLEDKINALTNGTQFQVLQKDSSVADNSAQELKEARETYEQIVGKKGGPSWTVDQIKAKIMEYQIQEALEGARAKYLEVIGEKADDALTVEEMEAKINEKQS
ncbi:hypothetical protein [Chryseobacterium vrystaatense]|uniref:Uncharacterized protein n=1 Tax=Chryseobacterium vrystaatense TaxID=307480 RepID=A0A1M4ZKP6_9FLAO|nr:hypothetical protein [Chryseobacterium vrystaatense]SHF18387.1 hypothetical protein SAMN02787073_1622 [Chryseobacterium vrystaatense]